ncbi:MAG TPA: uroporphyrinogen decarboxylase [Afifellaceae bacterium]|nr:uroporphyrinogen decarboxylase [Afifellaceae bacterium]
MVPHAPEQALLRVLDGEALTPPPIWLMRQAGRYLPEYREIRARAGSFLDLCYNPALAAEVTLQPVRRFGLDAAILFSDILVIPDALGQKVDFVESRGPVLEPVALRYVDRLEPAEALPRLAPVMEAIRLVRRSLASDKALIGFCGAPWTVATYMIAGGTTSDQAPARLAALREPEAFARLIDLLVDISAEYLAAQLRAGADTVQIFDSWAGILDEDQLERWSLAPVARIVERVRGEAPQARIIVFAKGVGGRIADYAARLKPNAVGFDWMMTPGEARRLVPERIALQGNLDPLRLVAGGEALDVGVDAILAAMRGRPHIFNLGHGISPETPIANVERLIARLRNAQAS